eukprot:scaffold23745_cov15-Tisochrysis_lutea.AAC.1
MDVLAVKGGNDACLHQPNNCLNLNEAWGHALKLPKMPCLASKLAYQRALSLYMPESPSMPQALAYRPMCMEISFLALLMSIS